MSQSPPQVVGEAASQTNGVHAPVDAGDSKPPMRAAPSLSSRQPSASVAASSRDFETLQSQHQQHRVEMAGVNRKERKQQRTARRQVRNQRRRDANGNADNADASGALRWSSSSSSSSSDSSNSSSSSDSDDSDSSSSSSTSTSTGSDVRKRRKRRHGRKKKGAAREFRVDGIGNDDTVYRAGMRTLVGRTSLQANKRLLDIFEHVISTHHNQYPFRLWHTVATELFGPFNIAITCCAFVCITTFGITASYHQLAEGLLLLGIVIVNSCLAVWRQYLEHTEVVRLLQQRMEMVRHLPSLAQTDISQPPSSTFVRVWRDAMWRALPVNLLVEGDVIELDPGQPLPCDAHTLDKSLWVQEQSIQANASTIISAAAAAMAKSQSLQNDARTIRGPHHASVHTSTHSWASTVDETNSITRSLSPPRVDVHTFDPPNDDNTPPRRQRQQHASRAQAPIIYLKAGQSQPQPSASNSSAAAHPQAQNVPDAMFESLHGEMPTQYSVDVSPLIAQLEAVLQPPSTVPDRFPPPNGVISRYRAVIIWQKRAALLGAFLYLVIAIIRLASLNGFNTVDGFGVNLPTSNWFYELFYRTVTIALPLLNLAAPLYLFSIDALCNGIIVATQEAVESDTENRLQLPASSSKEKQTRRQKRHRDTKRDESRSKDSVASSSSPEHSVSISETYSDYSDSGLDQDGEDDDANTFAFMDKLHISYHNIYKHTKDVLTGNEKYMTRRVNLVQVLGTATVFCTPDNEGILSENESSPDHLLFLGHNDRAVVLDLTNDPKSRTGITFEGEWQEYIASLKPIGLNCVLTNNCNLPDSMINQYDWAGSSDVNVGCLCLLSREIGFDVARTRQQYYISKAIHNVSLQQQTTEARWRKYGTKRRNLRHRMHSLQSSLDPQIRTMSGVSLQDRFSPEHVQLMSTGDPHLILANSTEYWDGAQIRQLDAATRSQLLGIYQQWLYQDLRCIGLSYTPVPSPLAPAFVQPSRPVAYLIQSNTPAQQLLQTERQTEQAQAALEAEAEAASPHPLSTDDSDRESRSHRRRRASADSNQQTIVQIHDSNGTSAHDTPNGDINSVPSADDAASASPDQDPLDSSLRDMAVRSILSPALPSSSPVLFHPELPIDRAKSSPAVHTITLPPQYRLAAQQQPQKRLHANHSPQPADYLALTNNNSTTIFHTPRASLSQSVSPSPVTTAIAASTLQQAHSLQPTDLKQQQEGQLYQSVQQSQVFIGVVAMRDQPKIEVRSLVESLHHAGIRFVYFSPDDDRKTQAFGSKIGLFTDFNFFVSLSEVTGDDAAYSEQGISKLPRGIKAIRRHLQQVDNVPLLVSLFTECTPKTAREMIRIYQENGETVLCMGSSLNVANTEAFAQANLAISLDPVPARECEYKSYNRGSSEDVESYTESREFALSSAITTMPCALPLPSTTDLHQFLVLIAQARRLTRGVQQTLWFAFCCHLTLFWVILLSSIVDTPPLFTVYQLIWLLYLIIPPLAISLMAAPREPDLMRRYAGKNISVAGEDNGLLVDRWRYVAYYGARFSITIASYILFFLWMLHASYQPTTASTRLERNYYWQSGNNYALNDPHYSSTLLAVQVYSQVMLVYVLLWHSTGFIHRYHSIVKLHPFKNVIWLTTCLVLLGAQVAFAAVSLAANQTAADAVNLTNSSFYPSAVLPIALVVWPLWILCIDEVCKMHDRKWRDLYHKQDRQEFNTILGMHSPR